MELILWRHAEAEDEAVGDTDPTTPEDEPAEDPGTDEPADAARATE